MRISTLSLFFISMLLQGCFLRDKPELATYPQAMMVSEQQISRTGGYLLNTGDRLRIVVFGQDSLSNAYQVDATGHVSMPLIGAVSVAGKTTKQAEEEISTKLKDGYVRQPHVAIEVETYRPFFILGEITASGQYPFVNGMTAQTAIAIAGGYNPRANRTQIEITRTINNVPMRAVVPLTHPIHPGDIINVPERWF